METGTSLLHLLLHAKPVSGITKLAVTVNGIRIFPSEGQPLDLLKQKRLIEVDAAEGVQTVWQLRVPPGTYREVEFDFRAFAVRRRRRDQGRWRNIGKGGTVNLPIGLVIGPGRQTALDIQIDISVLLARPDDSAAFRGVFVTRP